jgi:glycosyltransferase involved in cell wall biosynthesis
VTPAHSAGLPRVSVIVPCYGYADVLAGCVESVLAQEGVEVSVLIIDDRSPDDTPAVGQALANADSRVEYRRHELNAGLIATANEGLEWADGDYVLLLSADDLLVPGALQRATSVMEEQPRVGMVYGRPLLAPSGRPLPAPSGRWRGTTTWPGKDWIGLRCRTGHNCISSPEAVVRNSVQRKVGGYNPLCFHTSDLEMWLRIAAVSDIAYIRGVPQAIYRIHPGSMLRSQEGPLVDLRERRLAFDCFFEACGSKLRDPGKLHAQAMRALARQALWQASRAVDKGHVRGADAVPFDELVEFALEVYPDTKHLREWRGLQLRRMIGEGRSKLFPPFIVTGIAHRLNYHVARLRWKLRGV